MTPGDRDRYIVFGQPFVDEQTITEVAATLRSGWIGAGPVVERFEQAVAERVGARFAIAVTSCTVGLEVALRAVGVRSGDEVITSALTFVATANAIVHAGGVPVLVDVDPATRLLDPNAVEKAISSKTRAIVPVHLAGLPCPMNEIGDMAARHGVPVVDDAAHALGATVDGRPIGAVSELTVFSFGPPKTVTTGEGGMITTDDSALAGAAATFCRQGLPSGAWARHGHGNLAADVASSAGQNYRMTDIAATIGLGGLRRFDAECQRRAEIWDRYEAGLTGLPLHLPPRAPPGSGHAYQLYSPVLAVDAAGHDRQWLRRRLHERGIGTGVHYVPLPDHPYYRDLLDVRSSDFPVADVIGRGIFSLPGSAQLSDDDVDRIVVAVRDILTDA